MQQEFETKVLEIDVADVEKKLQELWAVVSKDTTLMKRWVFDIESHSEGKGKWIRLRQVGEKSTITYKNRNGNDIWATEEIETEVQDFDNMAAILKNLKRNVMAYQENKRKMYVLNEIEFCIDSWPMIPPYLEIESISKEKVHEWLQLLWLEWKDEGDIWVIEIYQKYWIDLHSHQELKFT